MRKFTILSVFCLFTGLSVFSQGTVTDIDGNVYSTVLIGEQEWMAENLRVTRYNNGQLILTGKPHTFWIHSEEGLWAWYDEDPANDAPYGKLYNWYAVTDGRGLCPAGWRVPTDDDWQELVDFVDPNANVNNNTLGTNLKSRYQVESPLGPPWATEEHPRWDRDNKRFGMDNFGFGALPAGGYSTGNAFVHKGMYAYFWSSTERQHHMAWTRVMLHTHRGMSRSAYLKNRGKSVRCIRGEEDEDHETAVNQIVVIDKSGLPGETLTLEVEMNNDDPVVAFQMDLHLPEGFAYVPGSYTLGSRAQGHAASENLLTGNILRVVAYSATNAPFNGNSGTLFTFALSAPNEEGTWALTPTQVNLTNNQTENVFTDGVGGTMTLLGEADFQFFSESVEAAAGEEVTITMELVNPQQIIAFQLDLQLPDGFGFVEGSYQLSDRANNHSPGFSVLSGNRVRLLAYSSNNSPFNGQDGPLFSFRLTTPSQPGNYSYSIENEHVINTHLQEIQGLTTTPGDIIITPPSETTWTPCPGQPTVTDIDGNIYNTVLIGDQCWMRENLRVEKYNDGSNIVTGLTPLEWYNTTDGAYDVLDHNLTDGINSRQQMINAYGLHYNWFAATNDPGICPTGWKLPDNEDWEVMFDYLAVNHGSDFLENMGDHLKSVRQVNTPYEGGISTTIHPRWDEDDIAGHFGTDLSGFAALPGELITFFGQHVPAGHRGFYWSADAEDYEEEEIYDVGWHLRLEHWVGGIQFLNYPKQMGMSVRCIKVNE